jgi:predicted DNA-binding transcriptional regulator AlpA
MGKAAMGKKNAGRGNKRSLGIVPPLPTLIVPAQLEQSSSLDRVVSEALAAEIIGYSKDTLRREFRAGRAPARVRLSGRRIGYRLSAIYQFLEAHTEQPGAAQATVASVRVSVLSRSDHGR